jgi:hypothetical protein
MARNPDDDPPEAEMVNDDDDDIQSEEDAERERRQRRRRRRRRDDEDYDEEQKDIGQDAGMRMLLPVGRSGWAIASGYLGLLSLLCIPAPLALITGIIAIRDIRKNPKKHGMGRAIFGIVMGSIGCLFLIIWVIAMIATGGRR